MVSNSEILHINLYCDLISSKCHIVQETVVMFFRQGNKPEAQAIRALPEQDGLLVLWIQIPADTVSKVMSDGQQGTVWFSSFACKKHQRLVAYGMRL